MTTTTLNKSKTPAILAVAAVVAVGALAAFGFPYGNPSYWTQPVQAKPSAMTAAEIYQAKFALDIDHTIGQKRKVYSKDYTDGMLEGLKMNNSDFADEVGNAWFPNETSFHLTRDAGLADLKDSTKRKAREHYWAGFVFAVNDRLPKDQGYALKFTGCYGDACFLQVTVPKSAGTTKSAL